MASNNKIKRYAATGGWVDVIDGDDYALVADYNAHVIASGTAHSDLQGQITTVAGKTVAAAGTTGQVLSKKTNTDYDTEWTTPHGVPAAGVAGDVLTKSSATDYAMAWAPPITKFGTATENVEIVPANNDKLKLVENTSDGRPYLSFWNQNTAGTLIRKGYLGYPEALLDTSDLYLRAEVGDLQLEAPTGKVYANGSEVLTTANEGSGNGLDADTVDTLHVAAASVVPGANQIVRTNTSGYAYFGYINTAAGGVSTATVPTKIFVGIGTDDFLRYSTPADFRTNVSADIKVCTTPFRAYDVTAATANVTVTLTTTVGGISLTGATGVFGSVTGVGNPAGGFVTVYPAALSSEPDTGNANFPASAAGSGFFFVALNASRQLKFYRNTNCRVILDIQGFIFG